MIKISKISKAFTHYLFLTIFVSFLSISVTHHHHFNIRYDQSQIFDQNNTENVSFHLNSYDSKCLIHVFNGSILNIDNSISSNGIVPETKDYYSPIFKNLSKQEILQFNLRAPPILFV